MKKCFLFPIRRCFSDADRPNCPRAGLLAAERADQHKSRHLKQSLNDLSIIDYYLTIFNQKESKIANRGVKVTDGSTPKKINF